MNLEIFAFSRFAIPGRDMAVFLRWLFSKMPESKIDLQKKTNFTLFDNNLYSFRKQFGLILEMSKFFANPIYEMDSF